MDLMASVISASALLDFSIQHVSTQTYSKSSSSALRHIVLGFFSPLVKAVRVASFSVNLRYLRYCFGTTLYQLVALSISSPSTNSQVTASSAPDDSSLGLAKRASTRGLGHVQGPPHLWPAFQLALHAAFLPSTTQLLFPRLLCPLPRASKSFDGPVIRVLFR
jgi:hypothetical protein